MCFGNQFARPSNRLGNQSMHKVSLGNQLTDTGVKGKQRRTFLIFKQNLPLDALTW